MTPTPQEKYEAFKALHEGPDIFVMPNPWDAGSAKILSSLGFPALATTSNGLAIAKGVRDSAGEISRDDILENAQAIVQATDLPVSADLENGFGDAPEACAETIRLASATGLVGGSIEDASTDPDAPIYEFGLAVERVQAAVEAARPLPFLLTARAEGFLWGQRDLDEIIRRLQAFEAAGADVLFAPGLPSLDAIRTVCEAVTKPVNVVMGLMDPPLTVAQLAEAGVKRVSVGGTLARTLLGTLVRSAEELRDHGTFGFAAGQIPDREVRQFFKS